MKRLNESNEKADWENDLVNDLSFIKQKKRYPFNKRTFKPAVIAALLFAVIGRGILFLIITNQSTKPWAEWILGAVLLFLVFLIFYQYFQTLRFHTIDTRYNLNKNQDLLVKFFKESHLAYTQHNDAPEVYMIISRNLDSNPKKDYREVMVLIADDKRILVNSHFTGTKFSVTPPSRNFKKMANELSKWLDRHIDKANIQDITVKGF